MNVHAYLRKWLLDSSGLNGGLAQALTNWSPEFIALMRARMVQGFFRYGSMRDPALQGEYDNVGSAIKRLQAYLDDGNKEHLADAANLCMCEDVTESCHPSPHFSPVDDGPHTGRIR